VTYKGTDGAQYVAILSGVGGWPGVVAAAKIDPRVRNAALGFVGATQDLPAFSSGGSELLVFKLAGGQSGSVAPQPNPSHANGAQLETGNAPAR
jgi:alcohol dehydrogenase (cytochrome c)